MLQVPASLCAAAAICLLQDPLDEPEFSLDEVRCLLPFRVQGLLFGARGSGFFGKGFEHLSVRQPPSASCITLRSSIHSRSMKSVADFSEKFRACWQADSAAGRLLPAGVSASMVRGSTSSYSPSNLIQRHTAAICLL